MLPLASATFLSDNFQDPPPVIFPGLRHFAFEFVAGQNGLCLAELRPESLCVWVFARDIRYAARPTDGQLIIQAGLQTQLPGRDALDGPVSGARPDAR